MDPRERGSAGSADEGSDHSPRPPLIVIAGPTATGKTGLSLALAEWLSRGAGAEIISADSRQVYRGLDVGTAKIGAGERSRVPHHCLDLVDPDQPFSVHQFVREARAALVGIEARGRVALLVGGTGLWIRALAGGMQLDDLPAEPGLRAELEADLARDGLDALVSRLEGTAPALALRTDLRNPRRVVRALEIGILRGDGPLPQPRGYPGPVLWLGLDLADRALHRRWIARRAEAQLGGGILEEAAGLRRRYPASLPALSAIGYQEAFALLEGRIDRTHYLAVNVSRNVAFARRQRTWFRREPQITWFDPGEQDPLEPVKQRAAAFLRAAARSADGDGSRRPGAPGQPMLPA